MTGSGRCLTGSQWCHRHKMAELRWGIYWLHLFTGGGGGATPCYDSSSVWRSKSVLQNRAVALWVLLRYDLVMMPFLFFFPPVAQKGLSCRNILQSLPENVDAFSHMNLIPALGYMWLPMKEATLYVWLHGFTSAPPSPGHILDRESAWNSCLLSPALFTSALLLSIWRDKYFGLEKSFAAECCPRYNVVCCLIRPLTR